MGPILATAAVRAFSSPIYFCFHFRGSILREILISYKVIKPRGMSTKPVIVVAEFFGLYLHARTCLNNSKKSFLSWIYLTKYIMLGVQWSELKKKIRLLELGLGLKHPIPLKAFKFQFILYSHHPPHPGKLLRLSFTRCNALQICKKELRVFSMCMIKIRVKTCN